MCIRDRIEFSFSTFALINNFEGLFNTGAYEENMKNTTCLLYTSDAADDLLCVDLGGRRIIKKKFLKDSKFYGKILYKNFNFETVKMSLWNK